MFYLSQSLKVFLQKFREKQVMLIEKQLKLINYPFIWKLINKKITTNIEHAGFLHKFI